MSTIAISRECEISIKSEGVSLLGLPTEQSAKRRLSRLVDEVVTTLAALLNEIVLGVIEKRSAPDFKAAAADAFPRYVSLVLSYSKIVATTVPRETLVRLSAESFCELEADIREHGVASFGADLRDRAVFTVWTLRKISDLLGIVVDKSATVVESQRDSDKEFATEFLYHALCARFHIDCLVVSMRSRRPLYPDVLPLIDNGLRSAVDAYAWVKQAVDLRRPSDEPQIEPYAWTPEDQELVDSSMHDLDNSGDE